MNVKNIDVKPNKSSTYILPIIDEYISLKFLNNIVNSYIKYDENEDLFCILYDWSSDLDYIKFENDLMEHKMFDGFEDYNKRVLYKFKINEEVKKAIEKFKDGNYKNFSINQKESIINFLTRKRISNLNLVKEVLDKQSETKSTPPLIENEIFKKHLTIKDFRENPFVYKE